MCGVWLLLPCEPWRRGRVALRKFFALPLDQKMMLFRKENIGYSPLYAENLEPSSSSKVLIQQVTQKKSSILVLYRKSLISTNGPLKEISVLLPSWRSTMEAYHNKVVSTAKRLMSLIALALNLDERYFENVGALDYPKGVRQPIHYPGELGHSEEEIFGASAHSDYGMITLLVTDGVPGLQVCREKFKEPRTWENVLHMHGAFIVNTGEMTERWTNCLFRQQTRDAFLSYIFQVALFFEPNPDCIVQCLESCCSESCPPQDTLQFVAWTT